LEEARKLSHLYQIGDYAEINVTPKDYGRVVAQSVKNSVIQKVREAERDIIYDEFIGKEGDIVNGIVQRIDNKTAYVDLGKIEAVLLPSEQMEGERLEVHQRIKAYVLEVRKTTKGPQVLISRSHPGLLKRLFELEVPEIHDGIVEVKSIAREAGSRSKIAVYSNDENVDPVGACVGPKGARVQVIVDELKGEKIDIVNWSEDIAEFIRNSLSLLRFTKLLFLKKIKRQALLYLITSFLWQLEKKGRMPVWQQNLLHGDRYKE
jgi:N utilization substance protein A